MRASAKAAAVLLCGLAFAVAIAQEEPGKSASGARPVLNGTQDRKKTDQTLTADDGLSVIAAALDSRTLRHSGDCSHMVHAIYLKAGFPYTYVSSTDLYHGVEGFRRVTYPQPGDLIVWSGHVGIIVRPSRHVFFSLTSTGAGIEDYTTPYWTSRGRPHFYRYVKHDHCPGCVLRATR